VSSWRWPLVAGMLVSAVLSAGALPSPVQKRVLILWGGRVDLPANVVVNQVIRGRLYREFGTDVDTRFEYVEPSAAPQSALRDFIRQKYAGQSFDVLIAIAEPAAAFVRQYGEGLFPGVPVVCWGRETILDERGSGPPLTGAFARDDPAPTVDFILKLQPDTRRLVVIAGGSPYDDTKFEAKVRHALDAYEKRLTVVYLASHSLDDVRERVAHLPGHTAIFWVGMNGDAAGRRLVNVDALSSVAASANAPTYGLATSLAGAGIVGGVLNDQKIMAADAADLAVRLLHGARVADVPVVYSRPVPTVDWLQLRRWRIPESRLPPGTVVLNKEVSLWEAYQGRIIGVALLCLAQAGLIVALLVQRARRREAELAAHEQRRALAHLGRVAVLGELSGAMAHELNQPLTAILSNAEAAQSMLTAPEPDLDELREILDDIVAADKRARDVIRGLRAMLRRNEAQREAVDMNQLAREVIDLAHADLLARGVTAAMHLQEGLLPVAGDRVQLQQVLLNLILNGCDAMASSAPHERELTVASLGAEQGRLMIRVQDRGHGIAPGQFERIFEPFFTSKTEGLGLGLSICRTIAGAHGGRLWATNNDGGRGATLHLTLPCVHGAAAFDHNDPGYFS
jgi:signal transduction histidine kinase